MRQELSAAARSHARFAESTIMWRALARSSFFRNYSNAACHLSGNEVLRRLALATLSPEGAIQ